MNWIKSFLRSFALWLLDWVDYCPICKHSWLMHECPKVDSRAGKICSKCERVLPISAIKFHDGLYYCKDHKPGLK